MQDISSKVMLYHNDVFSDIINGLLFENNYKTSDVVYKSNNIMVFNNGFHYYKGNSYLSIITMLNYKE